MPAHLALDTVLDGDEEVSRMVQRTVRILIAAIVSVMVVWGGGAAAGALGTGTGPGAGVPRPGEPAPVVIPSPERPAGLNVPPTLRLQE